MSRLLLHICCAPCAIYPVETLRAEGVELMGYFYPHNIHPYTECLRRRETLEGYAEAIGLRVIYERGFDLTGFLRRAAFRESHRCLPCYHDRLRSAALVARRGRFDAFSTTLLYSRFQKHDDIREIGESVSKATGVPFHYADFRAGWDRGVAESRRMGLYRQQYCGCIYSERERYYRDGPAVNSAARNNGSAASEPEAD